VGKQSLEITTGVNKCGCQAFFEYEKLVVFKCKTHKNKYPVLVTITTKEK